MIRDAIQFLMAQARDVIVKSGGREYSTIKIDGVRDPECQTLTVHLIS